MQYRIVGNTMPAVEILFDQVRRVNVHTVRWNGLAV